MAVDPAGRTGCSPGSENNRADRHEKKDDLGIGILLLPGATMALLYGPIIGIPSSVCLIPEYRTTGTGTGKHAPEQSHRMVSARPWAIITHA